MVFDLLVSEIRAMSSPFMLKEQSIEQGLEQSSEQSSEHGSTHPIVG